MRAQATYDLHATRRYFNRVWPLLHVPNALDARAYEAFVDAAGLLHARRVFELGPGTGMLAHHLVRHAPCLQALQLSELSDALCQRLRSRFAAHPVVTVEQVTGPPPFNTPPGRFDRFVSCFVLDCMDRDTQRIYLAEAHRLLEPGGLFCAMSVTSGTTAVSRILMSLGNLASRISPTLALGARFVEIEESLEPRLWMLKSNTTVVSMGFATRLLVAEKRPDSAG